MTQPRIALAVLAAGGSARLGRPKQLLPVDGQPLLARTLEAGRRSNLTPKLLVLGHYADEIRGAVDTRGFEIIMNPNAHEGQASSLTLALRALDADVDGVVVALGDQPLLPPGLLDRLAHEYDAATTVAVRPRFADGPGNPVLLGRALFPELLELRGDVGARDVLRRHASVIRELDATSFRTPRDVDTDDDYQALLRDWASLGWPDPPIYCQRCGAAVGQHELYGRLRPMCPQCRYVYFYDPKLVVSTIIEIDGKVVMQQRAVDPGAGRWSIPSGFVDRGEDIYAAAEREVLEEVGLRVTELEIVGFYSEPGETVALAVFATTADGQLPTAGDETLAVTLAAPDALPELAFARDARLINDWLSWKARHLRAG